MALRFWWIYTHPREEDRFFWKSTMLIKEKNSANLCSMQWHELKQLLHCHCGNLTCFLCSVLSVFLQMASMCLIKSHLCLYRRRMYYVHISIPRWNQNTFMFSSGLLGKKKNPDWRREWKQTPSHALLKNEDMLPSSGNL